MYSSFSLCFFFFFFLMIRRPPRSTLFPTRRSSDLLEAFASCHGADFYGLPRNCATLTLVKEPWQVPESYRSEEHTSELQSQSNLVCRLLLEKKKKKMTFTSHRHITTTLRHLC